MNKLKTVSQFQINNTMLGYKTPSSVPRLENQSSPSKEINELNPFSCRSVLFFIEVMMFLSIAFHLLCTTLGISMLHHSLSDNYSGLIKVELYFNLYFYFTINELSMLYLQGKSTIIYL